MCLKRKMKRKKDWTGLGHVGHENMNHRKKTSVLPLVHLEVKEEGRDYFCDVYVMD